MAQSLNLQSHSTSSQFIKTVDRMESKINELITLTDNNEQFDYSYIKK